MLPDACDAAALAGENQRAILRLRIFRDNQL